jgi:uncharacterized membrane protein YdjX (TVP38/TMEM64 family)
MPAAYRPIALAVVLTVLMAAGLLAVTPVREVLSAVLHGDLTELRTRLNDLGGWAALVLVALGLLHVLIPFPAELPNAAAGFAFGFWVGVPLMLGVWLISGLAAYWLARTAGRPAITRVLGEKRLAEGERIVANGGITGLIAVRLIPIVPFSFASLAAGLVEVPALRFAWTTVIGFLPLTAAAVLVGSRLQQPSLSDPLLWGPIVGALALLMLVGVARRALTHDDADGADQPPEPK